MSSRSWKSWVSTPMPTAASTSSSVDGVSGDGAAVDGVSAASSSEPLVHPATHRHGEGHRAQPSQEDLRRSRLLHGAPRSGRWRARTYTGEALHVLQRRSLRDRRWWSSPLGRCRHPLVLLGPDRQPPSTRARPALEDKGRFRITGHRRRRRGRTVSTAPAMGPVGRLPVAGAGAGPGRGPAGASSRRTGRRLRRARPCGTAGARGSRSSRPEEVPCLCGPVIVGPRSAGRPGARIHASAPSPVGSPSPAPPPPRLRCSPGRGGGSGPGAGGSPSSWCGSR